jgi:predicted dehydrogenase
MKWGILGCAAIAKNAIIPAILSVAGHEVKAIASRSEKKAIEFASMFDSSPVFGYEELLDIAELDAIYIPLPTGLHFEWTYKALSKGKHVLVEKSATTTLAQAEEIVKLAKAKNLVVVENFQFQHHSQHQVVKKMIENGEIGELRSFRSSFGFPPFSMDDNIRYNPALGGGALFDAGAYVLKATTFMLGSGYQVEAASLTLNKDLQVDWFGGAFLRKKDNPVFAQVAFGFDNFYQCNYEVWGSKGKITVHRAFTAKPGYEPIITVEKHNYKEDIKLESDDHFVNMISYFEQLVTNNDGRIELECILEQASLIQAVNDYQ